MACAQNEVQTDLGCIPNDPVGFVEKIYPIGLSLLGMVSILFLIIGGYTILSSGGNPEKLQKGKEFIFYAIAGLLLGLFGFVFVQIISGVIGIPGFS